MKYVQALIKIINEFAELNKDDQKYIDDLNFDVSEVIDLKKGDAFVLCTDGFWEYVYEDDIEKSFVKTKSPKEWLEKMLESLHENEKENNDNYSAIAVEV